MKKFQRRPKVVEVKQYEDGIFAYHDLKDFVGDALISYVLDENYTLGIMREDRSIIRVNVGDWVVKDGNSFSIVTLSELEEEFVEMCTACDGTIVSHNELCNEDDGLPVEIKANPMCNARTHAQWVLDTTKEIGRHELEQAYLLGYRDGAE
jgi:hypothetical protein